MVKLWIIGSGGGSGGCTFGLENQNLLGFEGKHRLSQLESMHKAYKA